MQFSFMACYAARRFCTPSSDWTNHMRFPNINKNKLHAVLCIAASAAVSITVIVQLSHCLF